MTSRDRELTLEKMRADLVEIKEGEYAEGLLDGDLHELLPKYKAMLDRATDEFIQKLYLKETGLDPLNIPWHRIIPVGEGNQ